MVCGRVDSRGTARLTRQTASLFPPRTAHHPTALATHPHRPSIRPPAAATVVKRARVRALRWNARYATNRRATAAKPPTYDIVAAL